jgi:chitin disaccharide deacetylase
MPYLVVNADDFGLCSGVNRGIVDANRHGIVTSTSLMTRGRHSTDAARLAADCPRLSVGLHVVISNEHDVAASRAEVEDQLVHFRELMGRGPTHLDSHHHVHLRPKLARAFRDAAQRCGVPLRACSEVRYCSSFYGQWAGDSHPEQVGVEGFMRLVDTEVVDGITELACHPGYPDPDLHSSYSSERALELQTLRDPGVRHFLQRREISLIGFEEVARLLATPA